MRACKAQEFSEGFKAAQRADFEESDNAGTRERRQAGGPAALLLSDSTRKDPFCDRIPSSHGRLHHWELQSNVATPRKQLGPTPKKLLQSESAVFDRFFCQYLRCHTWTTYNGDNIPESRLPSSNPWWNVADAALALNHGHMRR